MLRIVKKVKYELKKEGKMKIKYVSINKNRKMCKIKIRYFNIWVDNYIS